jgi:lysozyme family protein
MADFATALPYLLNSEGGYVNNPADKGGETYAGITATTARSHGYTGTMNPIPDDWVASIYKSWFWDDAGLDAITSQGVATALLDGIADGKGNMAKVAQAALTALGIDNDGDGQWGPNTLAAVNSADPDSFISALSDAWHGWYDAIIARDPSQQVFAKGWSNRADKLLTLQSGLAGMAAQVTTNPITSTIVLGVAFLGLWLLMGRRT